MRHVLLHEEMRKKKEHSDYVNELEVETPGKARMGLRAGTLGPGLGGVEIPVDKDPRVELHDLNAAKTMPTNHAI